MRVTIRRSGEVPVFPHSVKLVGPPQTLQWPAVCARCGASASERLPVTRAFYRDWRWTPAGRSIDDFRVIGVCTLEVPFCRDCIARHGSEARPVGIVRSTLSLLATPFAIPCAVSLLAVALSIAPGLAGPAGALIAIAPTTGRTVAFGSALVGFGALAWYQTRPRRIAPDTSVTGAFDFSDNLAGLFRKPYRVYGMESHRFAQAFRDVNADRLWTDAHGG